MRGRQQRFDPALLSVTVRCGEPVGLEPLEDQGELGVTVRAADGAPLQDDHPQQVSVCGTVLVKQQVPLQHKPTPVVGAIPLFL